MLARVMQKNTQKIHVTLNLSITLKHNKVLQVVEVQAHRKIHEAISASVSSYRSKRETEKQNLATVLKTILSSLPRTVMKRNQRRYSNTLMNDDTQCAATSVDHIT